MFFSQQLKGEKLAAAIDGFSALEFSADKPYSLWARSHLLGPLPLLELPLPSWVHDPSLHGFLVLCGSLTGFCLLRRLVGEVVVSNPLILPILKRTGRNLSLSTHRRPLPNDLGCELLHLDSARLLVLP